MPLAPARRLLVRRDVLAGWLGAVALVAVVYVVVVRGGGLLIGRTTSPHLGLSVLATAVVAVLIEPVRRRVETAARRRWGGGPSPYEVLSRFAPQVSGEVDGEQMPTRIARALVEGTGVAWAQVWLVVRGRLTLVATYPAGTDALQDPPVLGDDGDGLRSVPVGYAGDLRGVLRLQERPGRPLSSVEQRLFAGLAAQAGIALHNAQLRAELTERHGELAAQADELLRSRDELVLAQDQERRRLERDIHDGAQQQLVALGINLRLAQTLAESSPAQAAQLLSEQEGAARDAVESLTTLSRGLHPRTLLEQGLTGALSAAATASPVPVMLEAQEVGRFSTAVESAVYFCCLEALQNTAKHAGANRVDVCLELVDGRLRLTVTDDGTGLTPDATAGVGMTNMRERVTAVGGQVDIGSRPDGGTRVTAVVPAVRLPSQRGA